MADYAQAAIANDISNITSAESSVAVRQVSRRCRIALYSHDTMGLGHMRRNLLIAQSLASSDLNPTILLLAGAKEIGRYTFPECVDTVVLPSYKKNLDSKYESKNLSINNEDFFNLRQKIIHTTLQAYQPDILIVDNVPKGALGEIESSLNFLKSQFNTTCILGLRDILDEPSVARRQFTDNISLLRNVYDAIFVYGDPEIYNLTLKIPFSLDILKKLYFTGYLDQRNRLNEDIYTSDNHELDFIANTDKDIVLCSVGGGQDGIKLAKAFANTDFPTNHIGILVTGPFMPENQRQQLKDIARQRTDLYVKEFLKEPLAILQHAKMVISMGGYNSICEILSFNKPALIIPRIKPRTEQWVRAQRLKELQMLDVLHPHQVSSEKISAWLNSANKKSPNQENKINMKGFSNIPVLVKAILMKRGILNCQTN